MNHLADQVKTFLDLKEKVHRYRRRCEKSQKSSSSATDAVQPSDSISQVGSKVHEQRVCVSRTGSLSGRSRTSQSSTTSCLFDERIKLTADKTAMIAEVSLLCESGSLA